MSLYTRWRRYSITDPSGCRWCGIAPSHGNQYVSSRGSHTYEPPTNAQRLARMRARRAQRLAGVPIHTETRGLIVTWSTRDRCWEIRHHASRLLFATGWIRPRDAVRAARNVRGYLDWTLSPAEIRESSFRAVMQAAASVHLDGGTFCVLVGGKPTSIVTTEAAA